MEIVISCQELRVTCHDELIFWTASRPEKWNVKWHFFYKGMYTSSVNSPSLTFMRSNFWRQIKILKKSKPKVLSLLVQMSKCNMAFFVFSFMQTTLLVIQVLQWSHMLHGRWKCWRPHLQCKRQYTLSEVPLSRGAPPRQWLSYSRSAHKLLTCLHRGAPWVTHDLLTNYSRVLIMWCP